MTRPRLFYFHAKHIRDTLREARATALQIHDLEKNLLNQLRYIDKNKFYVHFGFRTLSGYCKRNLRLTKTQCQRIVTLVRQGEKAITFEQHMKNLGNDVLFEED
jgi:hypothetical protein